jgi:ribosomal protein S18 acetylase RimI-like enzyme
MPLEQMTVADFVAIKCALEDYWGPLDEPRRTVIHALHHPLFVHEFGEAALVVRDDDHSIAAYLLGVVAPSSVVGYIHMVGVRLDRRRLGLACLLYSGFERLARASGATSLKAISTPTNDATAAFHGALGFSAELVEDYSGPGDDRRVFTRRID